MSRTNSLEKNLKFNSTNFNKEFEENSEKESKKLFIQDIKDDEIEKEILDLTLQDIIIELRNMFYIILEYISKKMNPLPYIFESRKRKYVFGIFMILFGSLLLMLSSLMMEKI